MGTRGFYAHRNRVWPWSSQHQQKQTKGKAMKNELWYLLKYYQGNWGNRYSHGQWAKSKYNNPQTLLKTSSSSWDISEIDISAIGLPGSKQRREGKGFSAAPAALLLSRDHFYLHPQIHGKTLQLLTFDTHWFGRNCEMHGLTPTSQS